MCRGYADRLAYAQELNHIKLSLPAFVLGNECLRALQFLCDLSHVYLTPEQDAGALMLTPLGQRFFDRLFAMNARDRVERDLGNGAVRYRGAKAIDTPQLTLWRVTFYGGLLFAGDQAAPNETTREIAAITGPRRLVTMLCRSASGNH